MVWKVVKSAQPPVRYRPNSDRRPDIVDWNVSQLDGQPVARMARERYGILP